jgi:hypothetical protein
VLDRKGKAHVSRRKRQAWRKKEMRMPQHSDNVSEIARLRERIAREHEAACWALNGPALGTAQHWFITRRMERIGACQEQLATLVGEQASLALVTAILESSPAQKSGREPHLSR